MESKEEVMSRIKKSTEWRVGIFVFLGVISVFVCVILLDNKVTVFSSTVQYKVKLPEAHGLFEGSVVTVNGIPAGNVTDIQFIPQTGLVHVSMAIIKKFVQVINSQSEASLGVKGVLGDKFISITTGGKTAGTPLPAGSFISHQKSKGLMGFLGSETMKKQLSNIMEELSVFIASLNSEKPLEGTSQAIKSFSTFFSKDKSKDFSEILKRLKNILVKIDKGEGTAGALINNRSLYNRVLSLLGQKPYHKSLPSLLDDKVK